MNFEDEPWRAERACEGLEPTWWTRDGTPPQGRSRTRTESDEELMAKHVCWNLCPVREACLEAGVGLPGIWGGLDEWERSGGRPSKNATSWPFPAEIRQELTAHTKYIQDLKKARQVAAL